MMTCERGYYVRMGKLDSPEAEHSADHYFELRDKKAKKREEIASEQASVGYLDPIKISRLVRGFFDSGNNKDRIFYKQKLMEIYTTYGQWLDDYTLSQIKSVLRCR